MLFCRRVYGNMMGDAEDDSGSLDSDSDLILDGDAGAAASGKAIPFANISISDVVRSKPSPFAISFHIIGIMDTDDDDDDDDELEVNEMAAESLKNRKSAKPNGSTLAAAAAGNSDDDF